MVYQTILTKASNITEQTNVLVLCAGGGTSGLLANALNKATEEYHVPVKAADWRIWRTYGHYERVPINHFSATSCV